MCPDLHRTGLGFGGAAVFFNLFFVCEWVWVFGFLKSSFCVSARADDGIEM